MTVCSGLRAQLEDHALGAQACEELLEHLASCSGCTDSLRRWRALVARIDADVKDIAACAPSPHLVPRVLAMLGNERSHVDSRKHLWPALAGAVLVGLAAVFAFAIRETPDPSGRTSTTPAVAITRWHSPTDGLLRTPLSALLRGEPRPQDSVLQIHPGSGLGGRNGEDHAM